jgi:outer membrane protein insertion porin family
MVPEINDEQKTVEMTFFVDPGKRVYVRRVNMSGNTKTRDEVLRRELRQMESSWASTAKIERSKIRLERLGYFDEVNVETPPVVGTADQIDVNYTVVEKSSGNLSAGVGFSQTQGIVLNANVSQDNIFGSGKRVNLAFNNSNVSTRYSFGYYDPYFTLDGVSMGYNLGYSARNAEEANIANYSTDVVNSSFNFGLPLNENDRLRFNIDLKHTKLRTSSFSSSEIKNFVRDNGDKYITLATSIGWTHDTLNRAIFPSSGGQQRLSALATVPGSDLEYFKISYKHQEYFPLAKDLTFRLLGEVAYGDGYGDTNDLPFFEHYFAGGVRSIRGFDDNTIGPRDSRNDPFGGSSKIIGKAELFFPVPFVEDVKSIRIGSFIDAGTVSDGLTVGDMKYSVGISGEWLSPFGALAVSFALPLNVSADDKEQSFQFSFGSGF